MGRRAGPITDQLFCTEWKPCLGRDIGDREASRRVAYLLKASVR